MLPKKRKNISISAKNAAIQRQKLTNLLMLALIVLLPPLIFINQIRNPMTLSILWLVLPSFFLMFRLKDLSLPIMVFSLKIGTAILVAFYFSNLYNMWYVPSLYPRFLNISLEEIIFAFFWPMLIIGIHNMFFNIEYTRLNLRKIFSPLFSFIIIIFTIGYILNAWPSYLSYSYLFVGTLLVVPLFVSFLYKNKGMLRHIIPIGVIFFFLHMLSEIIGLKLGLWIFNGQYIAMLSVLDVSFPVEEFILWIILSAPFILSLWENFRFNRPL